MAEDTKDPQPSKSLSTPALEPLIIIAANVLTLGDYVSSLLKLSRHYKEAINIKRAITMQDKEEVCRLIRAHEVVLDFQARKDIRQAGKKKFFVAPRIATISLSELNIEDMNKKQLYGKLADELNLYLPSFSFCGLNFLHQICKGTKCAFNRREVAYVNPPEYPELYEKEFIDHYTSKEPYSAYLPDEISSTSSFRKFMFSVINTLTSGEISTRIDQLRTARSDPIPSTEKVMVVLADVAEAVAKAIVLPSKKRQTSLFSDIEVSQKESFPALEVSTSVKLGRKSHQVDTEPRRTTKRYKFDAEQCDPEGEIQTCAPKKKFSAESEAEKYQQNVAKENDCVILGDRGPNVEVEFKASTTIWNPGKKTTRKKTFK